MARKNQQLRTVKVKSLSKYILVSRQCRGSGSGRIRIILPDPDRHPGHAEPDRYKFKAKSKKMFPHFLTCAKLEIGPHADRHRFDGQSGSGSASKWKFGFGSASTRCRSVSWWFRRTDSLYDPLTWSGIIPGNTWCWSIRVCWAGRGASALPAV